MSVEIVRIERTNREARVFVKSTEPIEGFTPEVLIARLNPKDSDEELSAEALRQYRRTHGSLE